MKTALSHVQLNVEAENIPDDRDLFSFLGWTPIHDDAAYLGLAGANGESLWFSGAVKDGVVNDYDGPGVNHLAIGAASQEEVDAVVGYLTDNGIDALFETPRHRPDFAASDDETYYQVMFESPDRLLFEFVYMGPK